MARIVDHNEEPIEDLDAGVAADDVRGGTTSYDLLTPAGKALLAGMGINQSAFNALTPAQQLNASNVAFFEAAGNPAAVAQQMAEFPDAMGIDMWNAS